MIGLSKNFILELENNLHYIPPKIVLKKRPIKNLILSIFGTFEFLDFMVSEAGFF